MQWLLFFFSILFYVDLFAQPGLKRYDHSGTAQGTTYSISYFHSTDVANSHSIDSLFRSIDSSLSIYKPYSIISAFNNSKRGVPIDIHLKNVVHTSIQTYQQTNGIFDITIKPLMDAWGLGTKKQTSLPDSSLINNILPCVGSDKLFIENNFLSKSDSCIQIDVNGIAQGYTVDVIALYLDSLGIEHYLIELGGEIKVKEENNHQAKHLQWESKLHRMTY
jgi:FAD:protein FMN transferase